MSSTKRKKIMEAAEQLFRTRQFHEITLDEVAQQAAVGKGTIYLYFSDKQELFFQTAMAGFDDLCELLRRTATHGVSFREDLQQMCEAISTFFRQRRPLARMILNEGERAMGRGGGLRERWLQRRKNMTAAVAALIASGAKQGEIRADIPAEILAEFLLGMLRTRAIELEGRPERSRSHALLVELFIKGASSKAVRARR